VKPQMSNSRKEWDKKGAQKQQNEEERTQITTLTTVPGENG